MEGSYLDALTGSPLTLGVSSFFPHEAGTRYLKLESANIRRAVDHRAGPCVPVTVKTLMLDVGSLTNTIASGWLDFTRRSDTSL